MSSQDTKHILAEQQEDIDKNKKVLTALHQSVTALTFMVKNIVENLDKYDEKDDIKVKIKRYLIH